MLFDLTQRIILEARYIIKNKATVRQTAKVFGVSKSCVHKDVSVKLKKIDYLLFMQVKDILAQNFKEKHLRGGQSTKNKFAQINKKAL